MLWVWNGLGLSPAQFTENELFAYVPSIILLDLLRLKIEETWKSQYHK